jgi:hypothetical protein
MIDYKRLNDKIVDQAYSYAGLSAKDLEALYEAKIARAEAMIKSRTQHADVYFQIED